MVVMDYFLKEFFDLGFGFCFFFGGFGGDVRGGGEARVGVKEGVGLFTWSDLCNERQYSRVYT